jgi:hypothetical protein
MAHDRVHENKGTRRVNMTCIQVFLASLIPLHSFLARFMPRNTIDVDRRDARHQTERDSRTSPQAIQVPV